MKRTNWWNPLRKSALEASGSSPVRRLRRALAVETLEDRSVPAGTVSVADATVMEGDTSPKYLGSINNPNFGGHFNPLTFGPDGRIYTAVGTGTGYNSIQRYDAATGAFIDTFVPADRINGVRDIMFRDEYLYVASAYTDEVLRYDASTGTFVDVFVTANSGGIDHPDGMVFGPDSNSDGIPELYVTGWLSHSVVRYDGATGQPLGTFITSGSGGLAYPFSLAFGPGAVFVTSADTNQILKYDPTTGAYLGIAASMGLDYPRGLTFGPDGLLYVTSGDNDRIIRFTSAGQYVDDFVPSGAGGMDNPRTPRFGPNGELYVTSTGNAGILRFGSGSNAVFTIQLSVSNTFPVTVSYTTASGTASAGSDFTPVSGTLTFAPGQTSLTILVSTLDDAATEARESFSLILSNPTGATLADGVGVASIADNDNKFFVVDDATANQTYEYGSTGTAGESYGLAAGNTAPRGVASSPTGDMVWVLDANNGVYVYDSGGGLLGSWTAAGMKQPEGITVFGNDIWIVDGKHDRVFRWIDGASRRSGATYSNEYFALGSGNKDPKDLVTDGTSIWVVNSSSTDKVFKYTLAGAAQGSWTIDAANASPTGITLDPTGASQSLWIVDNGTDKVYEYAAARSRTSGSQAASAMFNLAAGNTNPQGIADPPVGNGEVKAPSDAAAKYAFVNEAQPNFERSNESQSRMRPTTDALSVPASQAQPPRSSASPDPSGPRASVSFDWAEFDFSPIDVSSTGRKTHLI